MGLLPWFLRATNRYVLAADISEISLPTDFRREYDHELYALWLTGVGPVMRVEYFSPTGAGTLKSGRPCYWIDGNIIRLDRRYLEEIEAEYLYYRKDAVLDSNFENLWLENASQYLVGAAGVKLSGLENTSAKARFMEMVNSGKASILRQDAAYRFGGRKPQFGAGLDREYYDRTGRYLRYNDVDIRE